jgi:hypothetical protein
VKLVQVMPDGKQVVKELTKLEKPSDLK